MRDGGRVEGGVGVGVGVWVGGVQGLVRGVEMGCEVWGVGLRLTRATEVCSYRSAAGREGGG